MKFFLSIFRLFAYQNKTWWILTWSVVKTEANWSNRFWVMSFQDPGSTLLGIHCKRSKDKRWKKMVEWTKGRRDKRSNGLICNMDYFSWSMIFSGWKLCGLHVHATLQTRVDCRGFTLSRLVPCRIVKSARRNSCGPLRNNTLRWFHEEQRLL